MARQLMFSDLTDQRTLTESMNVAIDETPKYWQPPLARIQLHPIAETTKAATEGIDSTEVLTKAVTV